MGHDFKDKTRQDKTRHLTFSKFFVLLALLLTLVPLGVLAAPGWAAETKTVSYQAWDGSKVTDASEPVLAERVLSNNLTSNNETGGWYYVDGSNMNIGTLNINYNNASGR